MTEPENFEDDLFADLYEENDASRPEQGALPAAPAPHGAPSSSSETQQHVDDGPMQSADKAFEPELHPASRIESFREHEEVTNETGGAGDSDDAEDEVDFNLGGHGNSAAPASHQGSRTMTPPFGTVHKASAKDDGKMFIGGLNWETTDQSLRDYFSQFGEVVECTVMRDSSSGRSRGFGFLTFKDAKTVNVVMVKEHFLDGKIIDPKRAIPRDEQEKTSKIFVGGVSQETTDQEFKDYFAQFGRVVDATLMMDKDTGRPRGFGFVTFENETGVDACINVPLELHGKPVEVKKAQPRGNIREEEETTKRNKFRKNEEQSAHGDGPQQSGSNGMSPQVMAQYFQRMQQYFAMMQSQMAMNRGMQMNPAMWQNMLQMQQMQQQMMGRGGGGSGGNPQNMMANASPQMVQQMQQQMMQQMQQQQQQQQLGAAAAAAAAGGSGGDVGSFGGFQQAPPQGPSAGRRGGGGRGGAYGGGPTGGYGGGAPTSWEGMYDDVPQPGSGAFRRGGQGTPDPQNAPPANAPTGPKNAGRPGANYRGGGRGGSRGFHPYAR